MSVAVESGEPAAATPINTALALPSQGAGRSGRALARPGSGWRRSLALLDAVGLVAPAALVPIFGRSGPGILTSVLPALAAPLVALLLLELEDRRRAHLVPTHGLVALGQIMAVAVLTVVIVDEIFDSPLAVSDALLAGLLGLVLLASTRGVFVAWLGAARVRGRHLRTVLLVGTGVEAYELWRHLTARPDSGYRVVGVVGDVSQAAEHDWSVPVLGGTPDAVDAARACGAGVIVLAGGGLAAGGLNRLVGNGLRAGLHVQLSPGLDHVGARRLRTVPVAHRSLLQVIPSTTPQWQQAGKRAVDVVGATLLLVLASPVLLAAALAIRIADGSPVLFRQTRVGRGGQPFTFFKLRTMTCDAEDQRQALKDRNERTGPLFKVSDDPRVTTVGRVLRVTSIDELPQLFNVLAGQMSLVGPRPALPDEVACFDAELRDRTRVRPGITGLWQVEARDNPAFSAYRQLDLYYVENWSLGLDLAILLATVPSVIGRVWRARRGRSNGSPIKVVS